MKNTTLANHAQLYVSRETGEFVIVSPQYELDGNFLDPEEFTKINCIADMRINFTSNKKVTVDLELFLKTTNFISIDDDGNAF